MRRGERARGREADRQRAGGLPRRHQGHRLRAVCAGTRTDSAAPVRTTPRGTAGQDRRDSGGGAWRRPRGTRSASERRRCERTGGGCYWSSAPRRGRVSPLLILRSRGTSQTKTAVRRPGGSRPAYAGQARRAAADISATAAGVSDGPSIGWGHRILRGAPTLNVIVEKFKLKLSKLSTKSSPRLPNS